MSTFLTLPVFDKLEGVELKLSPFHSSINGTESQMFIVIFKWWVSRGKLLFDYLNIGFQIPYSSSNFNYPTGIESHKTVRKFSLVRMKIFINWFFLKDKYTFYRFIISFKSLELVFASIASIILWFKVLLNISDIHSGDCGNSSVIIKFTFVNWFLYWS